VPLIKKIDTSKTNVKDLIVRAKAGMQVGDAQKEAHLSFYIGMVHETKKEFREAVKAYRRFMICAQNMEDKVGVALAMNRIGINYFNIGKHDKSEEFHKKNLELTDKENSFAGYYNLGITYRAMRRLIESLENFKIALEWAREYKVTSLHTP
jgi:tetratricopeptide (TPR) repeat protein